MYPPKLTNEASETNLTMSNIIKPRTSLTSPRDRTNADPETVLALAKIEGRDWNCKLYGHQGSQRVILMAKVIGYKRQQINAMDSWSRCYLSSQRRLSFVLQDSWKCYKAKKVLKQNKKHTTLVNYVINKKEITNDIHYLILQFL